MNKQKNEWMSCSTLICGAHGLVGCLTKKRFAYAFPAHVALRDMLIAHYTSLRIQKMEEMTILLGCQRGMSGKFSFYK